MTRQKAIVKAINIVVIITFLWTNCVLASQLYPADYQPKTDKLAVQSYIKDTILGAQLLYIGDTALKALVERGAATTKDIYVNIAQLREDYLKNVVDITFADKGKVGWLVFADNRYIDCESPFSKRKQYKDYKAYYVFTGSGVFFRYIPVNAKGKKLDVDDCFKNVLQDYGRLEEEGEIVEISGKKFYREKYKIINENVEFINTCLKECLEEWSPNKPSLSHPNTPAMAIAQWRSYMKPQDVPQSPLHTTARVHFFATGSGSKGWANYLTEDNGLYGKVLPPVMLEDGRSIVPIVGDIYEVSGITEEKHGKQMAEHVKRIKERENSRFYNEESRFHPKLIDIFGTTRMLDDYLSHFGLIKEGRLNFEITEDYDEVEVISMNTLKSLLWILHEKNDSIFRDFLASKQVSFETLINSPDDVLRGLVPWSIFHHGDQVHWADYYETHKNSSDSEFHILSSERWKNYPKEWKRDEPFDAAMVKWFKRYQKLGDYLDISFTQGRRPHYYGNRGLGSLTTDSLRLLLKILHGENDPVLNGFLEKINNSFNSLINMSREKLIKIVPELIWFRAERICWEDYWDKNKEREDVKRINEMRQRIIESSEILKAWQAEDEELDHLDIKGQVKVKVSVKKLTDGEIKERFGLERVNDEQGIPASMDFYTFKEVVGRLAILYGDGGFVEAQYPNGMRKTIDTQEDFFSVISSGAELRFIPGRLEFKALGTVNPKIYKLEMDLDHIVVTEDGRLVVEKMKDSFLESLADILGESVYGEADIDLMLEEDGRVENISLEQLRKRSGIFLNTKYQPGFPSPCGTENARFSEEGMSAEARFTEVGGESPYHTFSRFSLGSQRSDNLPLAGSLRLTRQDKDRSLRIAEALREYQLDSDGSLLGTWVKSGEILERLDELFRGLGENQFALLAMGKVWILLGNKILHNVSGGKVISMDETYKFFLNNTDIVNGRQADLGDILDLKDSLNDQDIPESIAIMVAMASQLIHDLEDIGIVNKSEDIRKKFLRSFISGFINTDCSAMDVPFSVNLKEIEYEEVYKIELGVYFKTFQRKQLLDTFENLVAQLTEFMRPVMVHWPVLSYGYTRNIEVTGIRRFTPYEDYEKIKGEVQEVYPEAFSALDRLKDQRPQGYADYVLRYRNRSAQPPQGSGKVIPQKTKEFSDLMSAIDLAFRLQKGEVILNGESISLKDALDRLNKTVLPDKVGEEVISDGNLLGQVVARDIEGTIDKAELPIIIEKKGYKEVETLDIKADPRHQEVIHVIEGRVRINIGGKEQIVESGELISMFGSYTAKIEKGTMIIRVVQKDKAGLTADLKSDAFLSRLGEDVKKQVKWERDSDGNIQFIYLPSSVNTKDFASLSDVSYRLGIATKNPAPGLGRLIHAHPVDKPEVMMVVSGQVKYIIYSRDGKKIGEKILNPGDMIMCVSTHNAEFIGNDTKIVEVPVGPFSQSERWTYYDLSGAKKYAADKLGDRYDEGRLVKLWELLGLRQYDSLAESKLNMLIVNSLFPLYVPKEEWGESNAFYYKWVRWFHFGTQHQLTYSKLLDFKGKDVLDCFADGDFGLMAMERGAKSYNGFDISQYAMYFYELKMTALRNLNFEEFRSFFVPRDRQNALPDILTWEGLHELMPFVQYDTPDFNYEVYNRRLRNELSEEAREYFDTILKYYFIKDGKKYSAANLYILKDVYANEAEGNLEVVEYLQSEENYNRYKDAICSYGKERIHLEQGMDFSVYERLIIEGKKYDIICLGNIPRYYKAEKLREMFEKLGKLLNPDGQIVFHLNARGDQAELKRKEEEVRSVDISGFGLTLEKHLSRNEVDRVLDEMGISARSQNSIFMYRKKIIPSGQHGLIIRGSPEILYRELEKQKDTITDLRPKIDRSDVVRKLRDILDNKRDKIRDKTDIGKIEQAISDLETFDIKEFSTIVLNADKPKPKRQWLLGFNSLAPPMAVYLKGLFPNPTLGYIREAIDCMRENTLLEYLLHESLCRYTGHYKAREIAEVLFHDINYKDAEGESGRKMGNVNKALSGIIEMNFFLSVNRDGVNSSVIWDMPKEDLIFILRILTIVKNKNVVQVLVNILDDILEREKEWKGRYYSPSYGEDFINKIRNYMVEILGNYPEEKNKIIPVLIKALSKLKYEYQWRSVVYALGMFADRKSLPYLLEVLDPYINKLNKEYEESLIKSEIEGKLKWANDTLESFGKDYVEFVRKVCRLLEELDIKDKAEFDKKLKELIKLGNENPTFMAGMLGYILNRYAASSKFQISIIYVISMIKGDDIENEVIDLLKSSSKADIKEYAAIILSQWCARSMLKTKRGQRARETLAEVLGEQRADIFDKYGVWIIDLRVTKEYKFAKGDIDRIEKTLALIPKEHLGADICRIIVRTYPEEYKEEVPEWLSNTDIARIIRRLGTYDKLLRMVRVNETVGIERVICHEIGHGVHYFCTTKKQWRSFTKLHRRSVKKLPPEPERYRKEVKWDDFAYPYGATNQYEDFATIYEMWLTEKKDLEGRAKKSQLLNRKYEIVRSAYPDLPDNDTYWKDTASDFEERKSGDSQPLWFYERWLEGLPYSARIFEVACGSGRAMETIKTLGYPNIKGSDISEDAVAIARKKGLDVSVSNIKTDSIPCELDAILASDILLYLTPQELDTVMQKLYNTLNEGGRLAIRWAKGNNEIVNKGDRWVYLANQDFLEQLMARYNFEIIHISPKTEPIYVKDGKGATCDYFYIVARKRLVAKEEPTGPLTLKTLDTVTADKVVDTKDAIEDLIDLLKEPDEDKRFEILYTILSDEISLESIKKTLEFLFLVSTYEREEVKGNISNRKRVDLLAKVLAIALRRKDSKQIVDFLKEIIMVDSKKILQDAKLLIRSHLDLLDINCPLVVSTVIGVYEGQIALRKPDEHQYGEDAVRRKIMQYEDYFGLNPHIDWKIIYVVNGDDRYVDKQYYQETTTNMILQILKGEYPEYLSSGRIKLYEMEHELRESIGSVHGGCTIYGMRKAIEDGADIVVHNNIDLDCHTALIGSMMVPVLSDSAGVVVGSNRVRKGTIRDYNKIRLIYSILFNLYARMFSRIGNIKDPQNAFKVFSKKALERIIPFTSDHAFEKYFDYHFTFPNQLISRAQYLKLGVIEVPSLKHWSAELATPKPFDAFYMILGIWKQCRFRKIWIESLKKRTKPEMLVITEEIPCDGYTYVQIKEEDGVFRLDNIEERFSGETDKVKKNLRELFLSLANAEITKRRLCVLRKALSKALVSSNANEIADFLKSQVSKGSQIRAEISNVILSFLAIYDITFPVQIATVMSLFRKEDYIHPENLRDRVEQLEDLYRVNSNVSWRLIIVYEPHPAYSDSRVWINTLEKSYADYVKEGQIEFTTLSDEFVSKNKSWKGGSIIFGMWKAKQQGADYVIFGDVKPAIDLCQEGLVIKPVIDGKKTIAIGSRRTRDSYIIRNLKRRIKSFIYNKIIKVLFPHLSNIEDTQCPLKCFSRQTLDEILPVSSDGTLKENFDYDLSFDTQLLSNAVLNGYKIIELPVIFLWPYRELSRFQEGLRMLRNLIKQRKLLSAVLFIKDGREMNVYLDPSKTGRVIKVPKIYHPSIVTSIARGLKNRIIKGKSARQTGVQNNNIRDVLAFLIRNPFMLRLIKWIQTKRYLRTLIVDFIAGLREEKHIDVNFVERINKELSGIVANLEVKENAHVFAKSLFGGRKHLYGTVITQEYVPLSLEEALGVKVKQGDIEGAKRLIDRAVQLQEKMWQRGYYNMDTNILNDVGITEDNHCLLVDIGDVTNDFEVAKRAVTEMSIGLFHMFSVLSIKVLSEELAVYYDNKVRVVYTLENLINNWNRQIDRSCLVKVVEETNTRRIGISEIKGMGSGQSSAKSAVVVVANGGKGLRQGLLTLVSGSKGDIRILGKKLKEIAGEEASVFSHSLSPGYWYVWVPADSVLWALDTDIPGFISQVYDKTGVIVLGFENQEKLRDPPFSGIWAIPVDKLQDIKHITELLFERAGIEKYETGPVDWWLFLIRPAALTLEQWKVASGHDEFNTETWQRIWEIAQEFSRGFASYTIPSTVPCSNTNSPQEIYETYQKLLQKDSLEDIAVRNRIRHIFKIPPDCNELNATVYGRVSSEGSYLLRNSIIRVPDGVTLVLGKNVVIDDSIIEVAGKPGETIVIPEGTVIVASRLKGRLLGNDKFGLIYRVISSEGISFRERSVQVTVFLKDGRVLQGVTSVDFEVKRNLKVPIEGLNGLSIYDLIKEELVDLEKSTKEQSMLLEDISSCCKDKSAVGQSVLARPTYEVINPLLSDIKMFVFDWHRTVVVGVEYWKEIIIPILAEIIFGEAFSPANVMEIVNYVEQHSRRLGSPGLIKWAIEEAKSRGRTKLKSEREYVIQYAHDMKKKRKEFLRINPDLDVLFKGIREFMLELKKTGVNVVVLTAGYTEEKELEIEEYGLKDIVAVAIGRESGESGSSLEIKLRKLKLLMEQARVDANEVALVGDDIEDIQVIKRCGGIAIGYASDEIKRKELIEAGADIIINGNFENIKIEELIQRQTYDLAGAKKYAAKKLRDKYNESVLEQAWESLGLRPEDSIPADRLNSEIIPLAVLRMGQFKGVQAGIECAKISFDNGKRFAEGKAVRIDPGEVELRIWYEPEAQGYDFSRYAQTKGFAEKSGREFREFPGKTVSEFTSDDIRGEYLFAVNGHQGNFWVANTLLIINGKVVMKRVPAIGQAGHIPLTGTYNFFVLDSGRISIRTINFVDDIPQEDISGINYAISGPLLISNGEYVYEKIEKRAVASVLDGNQVTWDPDKNTFSFSAIGIDADGKIVQVSMAGGLEKKPEVYLAEIAQTMRKLGCVDAILLGTSKDTQQYVRGDEVEHLVGKARISSDSAEGRRPLGSIVFGTEKRKPDTVPQGSHIVCKTPKGKEKTLYAFGVNENGVLIGEGAIPRQIEEEIKQYASMLRGTLDRLEHIYGLGIFTKVRDIQIVENLRSGGLYPKGRSSLASYKDGVLKVDRLLFKNGQWIVFEELGHEFSESIAGIIPGSNKALSDVVSTYRNVLRFLNPNMGITNLKYKWLEDVYQEGILMVLRAEDNPIDPDGEYLALLTRLRDLQQLGRLTKDEIIASVVRYAMRTKLYRHIRKELGLPGDLARRIRDLDPKIDDVLQIFNEIREGAELIKKVKENEELELTVVKTFTGLRVEGLDRISPLLAYRISAVAKQISITDKLAGKLKEMKGDWQYILVTERRLEELKKIIGVDEFSRAERQLMENNVRICTEVPQGVDLENVIRLVDPSDIKDMPRIAKMFYLAMPYMRSSLYMAALIVRARGDLNSIPLVKELIMGLYKELDEDDLADFIKQPWKILPKIQSVMADMDNLRKAIVLLEKAA